MLTVAYGVKLTIVLQLIAATIFLSMASGALIPTPWLVASAVYMGVLLSRYIDNFRDGYDNTSL